MILDFSSEILSPPLLGEKRIDSVWHVHLLDLDRYQYDCRLLSGGYVIQHLPIMATEVLEKSRYTLAYMMHCKRMQQAGDCVKRAYWPTPEVNNKALAMQPFLGHCG